MNTINLQTANNFKSTKESQAQLLSKLNAKEAKMFKAFIKSVNEG